MPVGGLDINGGTIMAEFNGIVNKIIEYLLDFTHICVDHLDIIGKNQLKADAFFAAGTLKGSSSIFYDSVDIKISPGKIALCIQRVQGQHALCQLVQALRFRNDPGKVFLIQLCRYGAVQYGFQITLDRGEGGTEVMGYVGNKVFLIFLHFIQLV